MFQLVLKDREVNYTNKFLLILTCFMSGSKSPLLTNEISVVFSIGLVTCVVMQNKCRLDHLSGNMILRFKKNISVLKSNDLQFVVLQNFRTPNKLMNY